MLPRPWSGNTGLATAADVEEIDIWRTAQILMDAHGDGAELEAAMRADKALEDGYPDAVNVWKLVLKAIQALQRHEPNPSDSIN